MSEKWQVVRRPDRGSPGRIAVGEVIGDVVRIDVLTTTVFQVGGADTGRPGQATGALVTFPNLEVLRSNVVNFTRDFPYVWDELTVPVASGHDLGPTAKVLEERRWRWWARP
jgi:small conductance mechanosensitive channel